MSDLHEIFLRAKEQENEKAIEMESIPICMICFHKHKKGPCLREVKSDWREADGI